MSVLSLNQLGVLSPSPLFQNLSLTISAGDCVGIVAQNGGGKSTLLRCIAGKRESSLGSITCSRGARIGLVEQEIPEAWLSRTLFDVILSGLPEEDRAYNEWCVHVLLEEFSTPEEYVQKPLKTLSGGWQRLASIAHAWVSEPDLLLLDEPTNHLDSQKIELLEKWVRAQSRQTPMIIVSHDRAFLDACTTRTLFLRPQESKLYAHSYSKARALLSEDDEKAQAKLEQDKKEAGRLRGKANELKNIGVNSGSDLALKKAKYLVQRAENLEQTFKDPHKERTAHIRLSSREMRAKLLVSFKDTIIRTPDGDALFKIENLDIAQGDRLVLLGENGVGKSVFIRWLLRVIQDDAEVSGLKVTPTIVCGYADQHMSQLPNDKSPFDYISEGFSLNDQQVRTLLAGAGFPVDQQSKPLFAFSSGQKARLGMLGLRLQRPNLYLLDEPTNHVDIAGQEKLEEEILSQEATCLLVSHDRRFVQNIGTRFLRIKDKKLLEE